MIETEAAARDWISALPECNELALSRLEILSSMLAKENLRQNLVSRKSLEHIWRRHFSDSAQLLTHVPRETSRWLDLGTGAGFPGLVIAILRPNCETCLVESRKRRIEWLETIQSTLKLGNVRVEGSRLESVETFEADVISARAFAPLKKLLDLSARFSTAETTWLLPKGRSAQQELDGLLRGGWRHKFHVEHSITEPEAGIIVGKLLEKKGKSP